MSVFPLVIFILWFFITSTYQVLTNIDVTCPLDWVQHPAYKNKCYRLGDSAVPYSSAPGGCQNLRNGSTVANTYNLEIHSFLTGGLLSPNNEYYTSLKHDGGQYVFTELNNEPLEDWNEWGTITGDTCTVYSNVGGVWYWHTNDCLQPCLYICEYTVPTPALGLGSPNPNFLGAESYSSAARFTSNEEIPDTTVIIGALPMVLVPVDSVPMSGRIEIFWSGMWGVLRDSEFPETVAIICNDLGHSVNTGTECLTPEACGTGQIWYERVSCDSSHVNLSDCLVGAKLSTQTDHSKDTIVYCGDPLSTPEATTFTQETTTVEEVTTTNSETTLSDQTTIIQTTTNEQNCTCTTAGEMTTNPETTAAELTTSAEETTTDRQTVVSSEPITPQNNVTIIYYNVTTTVNFTVTIMSTVYVTSTASFTSSLPCLSSSDIMTSASSPTSPTTDDAVSSPDTPVNEVLYEGSLPVLKAKNSAMYSTKTRQDQRPSAQVIGSFGVIVIVVILVAIVALDVGTVGKEISRVSGRKTTVPKKRVKRDNRMESTSTCRSTELSQSCLNINSLELTSTYGERK